MALSEPGPESLMCTMKTLAATFITLYQKDQPNTKPGPDRENTKSNQILDQDQTEKITNLTKY